MLVATTKCFKFALTQAQKEPKKKTHDNNMTILAKKVTSEKRLHVATTAIGCGLRD